MDEITLPLVLTSLNEDTKLSLMKMTSKVDSVISMCGEKSNIDTWSPKKTT